MVGDVPQVALQLLVGAVFLEARDEGVEHRVERVGGALELDDLARQLVDAPRDLRIASEDLHLDLVDVLLQPGHHRRVAVDDAVEDRVQDGLRPTREQLRVVLHAVSDEAEVGRPAMADRQHEAGADEDVDLAELHLLDVVQVRRGAKDDEERVAVALELRTLVGDDRVLDRELVQAELLGHR